MTVGPLAAKLTRNIREVYQQVEQLSEASGRDPGTIGVVAVSKYVDLPTTRALADCLDQYLGGRGPIMLGENRAQTLEQKARQWDGPPVQWHFIGPLQSNKISKVVPYCQLLHSIDRSDLLLKLERYAQQQEKEVQGLLEFNLSGDTNKHGWTASELDSLLPVLHQLQRVRIRGLMGMSGLDSDPDQKRAEFQTLADLRVQLKNQLVTDPSHQCDHLSMGMSSDMPQAIAAGSTLLRIGTAFFRDVL